MNKISSHSTKKEHKRLRICLISYRTNPFCGGQGVYVRKLGHALMQLGHKVEIVSGPPMAFDDPHIKVRHLPTLDLYDPTNPFRVPGLCELANPIHMIEWLQVITMGYPEPLIFGFAAYQFIHRNHHKFDIVHDNQSLSYGIWGVSQILPTVATIHHPIMIDRRIDIRSAPSFMEKIKKLRWYSFIGMQRRVARNIAPIITVSTKSKRDIEKEFKVPRNRIHVVPNGIDLEHFHPLAHISRESGRIIVTNSADTPLKGLGYLLKAVSIVSKLKPVQLVIVGCINSNGYIANLLKSLELEGRVTFTGRIDQYQFLKEYARASMAVIPSVYEGFGLPAGEAMACGVPVISTSGGALPEVVGDAGILVPPGDANALADAILNLMENPELAARLSTAGYERVHQLFSWQKAAEATVNTYYEAIDAYR